MNRSENGSPARYWCMVLYHILYLWPLALLHQQQVRLNLLTARQLYIYIHVFITESLEYLHYLEDCIVKSSKLIFYFVVLMSCNNSNCFWHPHVYIRLHVHYIFWCKMNVRSKPSGYFLATLNRWLLECKLKFENMSIIHYITSKSDPT